MRCSKQRDLILLLLCALAFIVPGIVSAGTQPVRIWWEGEAWSATDFPAQTGLSPQNEREKELLSGGAWVGIENYDRPHFLEYRIDVPKTADYRFYSRRFYSHGAFRYRFDDQPWQESGELRLIDGVNLRPLVSVNWVKLETVHLEKGTHTLRLEQQMTGRHNTAAYDCFLLSETPFIPRGKYRPGETSGLAAPGCFAFLPVIDPLRENAALNLRGLNEMVAGQSGFIHRKGDRFVRGDGEEIRFWTMTMYSRNWDHDTLDYLVKRLARQGFNLLRIYIPVFDQQADSLAEPDEFNIDIYRYLTHICKQQGMYVSINPFFSPQAQMKESYGFEGYKEKEIPHNLPYISPRFQSYYKHWMRTLLTEVNPYTGIPLCEDPAVAMIEILSEDSLLWWLGLPAAQKKTLEDRFGLWVLEQYGSLDAAYAVWGDAQMEGDINGLSPRVELFGWYKMTSGGYASLTPSQQKRCSDQVHFLADLQRGFFQRFVDFYRDLGYKGLIAPTGFATADPKVLEDIGRYTYLVTDVVDRHHYPKIPHVNPDQEYMAKYAVNKGDCFRAMSFLKDPGATAMRYKTVAGYPAIISEFGWVNPSPYKVEGPLFTAAYASLIGLDCLQWFGGQSAIDFSHKLEKFAFRCPEMMVQNPAAALIYRLGYVKESGPVVLEAINPKTMFDSIKARKIYDLFGYDPTRGQDELDSQDSDSEIDSLAFFAGKVQADFSPGATDFIHPDLNRLIDRENQTVRSTTGELMTDYGTGYLRIDAPKAQGIVGYTRDAGVQKLGDITIRSENEYSALVIVPLDDQPLSQSKKVLVQAATPGNPYGYQTEEAVFEKAGREIHGERIVNAGSQPWNMEKIRADVTFSRTPARAVVLDGNGYETGPANLSDSTLHLPEAACYVIVYFE